MSSFSLRTSENTCEYSDESHFVPAVSCMLLLRCIPRFPVKGGPRLQPERLVITDAIDRKGSPMRRNRFTPEQILRVLSQIEDGTVVGEACRKRKGGEVTLSLAQAVLGLGRGELRSTGEKIQARSRSACLCRRGGPDPERQGPRRFFDPDGDG